MDKQQSTRRWLWTWHCIRARDDRFALGRATFMFEVMDVVAGLLGMHDLTTPGVEPGLSRPRRDVLTTRRWGLDRKGNDGESKQFAAMNVFQRDVNFGCQAWIFNWMSISKHIWLAFSCALSFPF